MNWSTILVAMLMLSFPVAVAGQQSKSHKSGAPIEARIAERWDPKPGSNLYRWTRQLPDVDRIVVYRLEYQSDPPNFVRGVNVTVYGPKTRPIIESWRLLQAGLSGGCWSPGFEVEFYAGDKLLLTSQLCFHCQIATFNSFSDQAGFDARGPTGTQLLGALEDAFTSD